MQMLVCCVELSYLGKRSLFVGSIENLRFYYCRRCQWRRSSAWQSSEFSSAEDKIGTFGILIRYLPTSRLSVFYLGSRSTGRGGSDVTRRLRALEERPNRVLCLSRTSIDVPGVLLMPRRQVGLIHHDTVLQRQHEQRANLPYTAKSLCISRLLPIQPVPKQPQAPINPVSPTSAFLSR